MIPNDATSQQRIIAARAAAGMCDPADMAATMQQAREAIAARIAAQSSEWDYCAACGHMRKCHDPVCYVNDCDGTCNFVDPHDFSAANDAAPIVIADQAEEYQRWIECRGDLGL